MKQLISLAKSWAGNVRPRKRNAVLPTSSIDVSSRSKELAVGRHREGPQAELQYGPRRHGLQSFEMDDRLPKVI